MSAGYYLDQLGEAFGTLILRIFRCNVYKAKEPSVLLFPLENKQAFCEPSNAEA